MNTADKCNLAYIIGVALGDGNLSNPNGRATRLRVTCDLKYPRLIIEMSEAIKQLLPNNKVSTVKMKGRCLYISCYSNQWEKLLGWKVGLGDKFKQKVNVPSWIKQNRQYTIACLKGLMQTDGSIYKDRGYTMVMFVTIIPALVKDTMEMIESLGFKPHQYEITKNPPLRDRFNIRLSKNVQEFVDEIGLVKS